MSGGTWSGSLTVPEGAWYRFSVRFADNNTITATATQKFGVGALVALIGQSNMRNMYAANNTLGFVPDTKIRRFVADAWEALDQTGTTADRLYPSGFSSPRGPGSIALGNALRAAFTTAGHNIPVGLLE